MTKDAADLHVERWRDHWIDIPFDDEVEAAVVRIGLLTRYLKGTKQAALVATGLQDFEYDTLHMLMIRETPGQASPGALAQDLGVSAAGMTGRLDGLEKQGLVKRLPGAGDRRTVVVEITRTGAERWRAAMALRGHAEDDLAGALTRRELVQLNRLLKKLALHSEAALATTQTVERSRPSQ